MTLPSRLCFYFIPFLIFVSCESDVSESGLEDESRLISTSVLDIDLTQGRVLDLIINDLELKVLYETNESKLWLQGTNIDGDPELNLVPSDASENTSARGATLSYGAMSFTNLADYQRLKIETTVDLTQISPDFTSADAGCDIFVYETYHYNNRVLVQSFYECLGDGNRSTESFHTTAYTMGESDLSVDWLLSLASFRQGIVGYEGVSIPTTEIVVEGEKYDRLLYAETFDFTSMDIQVGLCSAFGNLDGSISIDEDGESTSGSLTANGDSYVVSSVKSTSESLTLDATLTGATQTLEAELFYGVMGELQLEVDQEDCSFIAKFTRNGAGQANLMSTDTIYRNTESENYDYPVIAFVHTPYTSPAFEVGSGLNLTPDSVQAADERMISSVIIPRINREDNDAVYLETSLNVPSDSSNAVYLRYAVNYGYGWVELKGLSSLALGQSTDRQTLVYPPRAQYVDIAVSAHADNLSANETNSTVFLTNINAQNLEVIPLGEREIYIDFQFSMHTFDNTETCYSGEIVSAHFELDEDHTELVSLSSSNIAAVLDVDDNGNFVADFLINDESYSVTGNISSTIIEYETDSCAGWNSLHIDL